MKLLPELFTLSSQEPPLLLNDTLAVPLIFISRSRTRWIINPAPTTGLSFHSICEICTTFVRDSKNANGSFALFFCIGAAGVDITLREI
jgi:hypothetical protein